MTRSGGLSLPGPSSHPISQDTLRRIECYAKEDSCYILTRQLVSVTAPLKFKDIFLTVSLYFKVNLEKGNHIPRPLRLCMISWT